MVKTSHSVSASRSLIAPACAAALSRAGVDATLDHRHLNDVMEGQPSAEAIARLVYEWCRAELPAPVAERITAVRAWETPKAYAEYRA